jgi:ribosomal protein S18 acetylase RimI-like enzyme
MNASPGPALTIRHAVPSDIAAVAAIHLDGWRWAYGHLRLAASMEQRARHERESIWHRILAQHDDGARLWAAEQDRELLGFVATGPSRDPEPQPPGSAQLYALYQHRERAGTGVARALVSHALGDLARRRFDEVFLWALASNERACRFYERGGWQRSGERIYVHEDETLPHVCYRRSLRREIAEPAGNHARTG